jgi:hypothetical protein
LAASGYSACDPIAPAWITPALIDAAAEIISAPGNS